jgi:ribonuclease BN (tRNA processing enzyme)
MSLSLTVLGSSATYPRPGNPCSGYLLQTPQAAVWADCGPGTFAALQEYLDPHDLTALWVSHLHPDHCADLLSAFNWLINTVDSARLPVYGPAGWADRLAAMLPSDEATRLVHRAFDVFELRDGHTARIHDLELHSLAVEHSVPSFGLRVTHEGKIFAYSGDTGPCAALVELAQDVDLLVCEAGANEPQPAHCTAFEAGTAAATAGSRRLMLTHLARPNEESRAIEDASRATGYPVDVARPGIRVGVGATRT